MLSVIEFSRSNQSLSEFFSVELEFIEEFHILGIDVLVWLQARGLSARVLRSDFHLFVRGCELKVSRTVPYAPHYSFTLFAILHMLMTAPLYAISVVYAFVISPCPGPFQLIFTQF